MESVISQRQKVVVLGAVNTLQPVQGDAIEGWLSKGFDRDRIERVLRALLKQGLVMKLGTGEFVVTSAGRAAFGSGVLAKERDANRMLHLFERSKGGREQA